jgi:hypothetical protein
MDVFKLKGFARFCRKAGIEDASLLVAIRAIEAGIIDADLGGGVFKQRIAREGQGKSGGFRTILLMRQEHRVLFVKGFAKKNRDNISDGELADFRALAPIVFEIGSTVVEELVRGGEWIEVQDET